MTASDTGAVIATCRGDSSAADRYVSAFRFVAAAVRGGRTAVNDDCACTIFGI